MKNNPSTAIIFITLLFLGGWGIWKIALQSELITSKNPDFKSDKKQATTVSSLPKNLINDQVQDNTATELLSLTKTLLESDQSERAIELVNDQYSVLSSEELASFKRLFIQQGLAYSDNAQYNKAQRLYSKLTTLFNDVDVWDLLSNALAELNDWPNALNALLKSSLLESDPDALVQKRVSLARIAAQLKQNYLNNNDTIRVQDLYQTLYDSHPGFTLFQFELALAQLRLGDIRSAKNLLSAIKYDPELGNAVQEQLAQIALQEQQKEQSIVEQKKQPAPQTGVVVPLTRAGNSFLVGSKINGRQTQLLLDTGASITALAPDVIQQLNLTATGEIIRLSTANGITESPLYLAKRIQLGQITVKNLVVAEIELGNTDRFKGLLGTDLLNKISNDYVIDNKNNQLIFRPNSR